MQEKSDITHIAWMKAASFAAQKHRHQIRKDGKTPYIAHPFRVAMIVRDVFGCDDPDVLAAALLHDTIEDTCTDFDEVQARFGERVAILVQALTKDMRMPGEERELEYDRQLAAAPWEARLIKLADVYDNISDAVASSVAIRSDRKVERVLALAAADRQLERAANLLRILADQLLSREQPI